jgi:LacI family transcriptional regulator
MSRSIATIKDIAKRLNISIATVSRALRDTHDVNRETREKVLAIAKSLNYKPNLNAIGLANRNTHNIGIILPFVTNYYFSSVVTGVQEVAESKGYHVILYLTNDHLEREMAIIRDLTISSLDGLLVTVSPGSSGCEHFKDIFDDGVPIVFFDRVPKGFKTSKVMQDDFNGSLDAIDHLVSAGYWKIAHLGGPNDLVLSQHRKEGYIAGLQKHNLPVKEEWIIHSGFSQEDGEADTEKLLSGEEIPDAIFAINDRKAIGAMQVLKMRNIAIGREIGVIGFTNDPVSALITPSLTTIAEPAIEIGRKSCELLLRHIVKKNFIPEEVILPGKLIVRESTMRS